MANREYKMATKAIYAPFAECDMTNGSLYQPDPSPDVAQIEIAQHLEAALVAGDASEKNYHIREALQLFVARERE